MGRIHFISLDDVELIGLSAKTKAEYCADISLPGDFVRLAEDVDPDASMRMLPFEQHWQVEGRVLQVADVWVKVGLDEGAKVWGFQYSFEGIEGRFHGPAFLDARFRGYWTGVLLTVDDCLWFVPARGKLRASGSRSFGDPVQIDALERNSRHQLLGSFLVGEDAGTNYRDLGRMKEHDPVWGRATIGQSADTTVLLAMEDFEFSDPAAVEDLVDTITNAGTSFAI